VTLQPDVGHVHAALCLVSSGLSAVIALGLLADFHFGLPGEALAFALFGSLFVACWCGLFALVLRGTPASRAAAGLGLGMTAFTLCTGMCALATH